MGAILDTRDLEEELRDLEGMEPEEMDEEERERLASLESLRDEVGGEWSYGVALIPESDWEGYCQELADELGYVSDLRNNPLYNCIDWSKWADEVRMDYSAVDFDGEEYLYRA